jgi:hypothetical protein
MYLEDDLKGIHRMGDYLQRIEDSGDAEMVVFFGDAGPGAAENRKRLKLSKGITPAGLMGAAMLVDG